MLSPADMKRLLNSPYRLLAPVERFLMEKNADSDRDKLHLHPSEICKKDWCPRSSWYRIMGYPEPPEKITFQKMLVFEEGHNIHAKWQAWLMDAGVLEAPEVPIFNEAHRIMGHADGIINDKKGRAVLEIKSVGAGTIRFEDYPLFARYTSGEITYDGLWSSIKHPFPSHVRQAQLYMYCLNIDTGILLYEWKATQEVKEFTIQYQPELVEPILASCLSVVRAIEAETPPERPTWLYEDHRVCKYCPFKKECWKSEDSSDRGQSEDGSPLIGDITRRDGEVSEEVRPSREADGRDALDSRRPRRVVRQ